MHRFNVFLASICLAGLWASGASAAGLGFYGTLEGGDGEWEEEIGGPDLEYDGDLSRAGFGFAFDTELGRQANFNYRMAVSVQGVDADFDLEGSTFTDELDLQGVVVDNTFGFSIYTDEVTRLWVGPRVRIGVFEGELDSAPSVDVSLAELGIGGVFGANFNAGPTVTFGLEAGFMFSGYGGEIDDFGGDNDLTGTSANLFLNGLVLFRLGR